MLTFNPENARECFDKLRVKGVAADNEKRNAIAHILAALITGSMGEATLTKLVLAAYGNPKTAKGKPVTTVAGLASPANNIAGGDVMRQAWKAAFAVNEMRFYPVTNAEGETELCAVPGADALIAAFINGDKGAPKGIYALKNAVSALQSEAMGALTKADTPQGEGEGEEKADSADTAPSAPSAPADMLAAMADYVRNIKGEDIAALASAIAELRAACDEALDHAANSESLAA